MRTNSNGNYPNYSNNNSSFKSTSGQPSYSSSIGKNYNNSSSGVSSVLYGNQNPSQQNLRQPSRQQINWQEEEEKKQYQNQSSIYTQQQLMQQQQLKEAQASFKIGSLTSNPIAQGNSFGDYYGNTKKFEKTPEDEQYSKSYKQSSSLNEKPSQSSFSQHQTSGSMISSSASKKAGPPPGLRNIGNTCFMNSILQCVFATPYLNDFFLTEYSKSSQYRSARLADAYNSLIKQVKQGYESTISPTDLKYAVSKVAPQFSGYGQQDAQEFLRFFLDGLHEELNRVRKKPPYKEMDFDKLPADQQSDNWWQYNKERDDSIITDLFTGQLMNKIECQSCNHCSYAFDNFMDLSISIPRKGVKITGYVDLKDCLKTFIQPERMEECGYKCQKCKKVDNFNKEMTVYRFPKIMVIHLKRFYNSYMRREKLNTTVNIPTTVDLSEFAPNSKHDSKRKAKYQLYGVSHHSGTLYGGHYIGQAGQMILIIFYREIYNLDDGKWYQCNDSWVKQCTPDLQSSSAYVLFYVMM
ncbi:ubiquitin carboxyl-terminal hydrolase 2-like [Stylonychia lemnae]|uniref:Ubiquitin carboxyl-terminal hydrolase n=1 Tax=Stylonychia lemnae TaxID=5949 RepID=A0A078AN47_STYLE|nr:ubiquitin carboxyl-terminal hydrolase 2-like [Stylonychia lemnae]|eukprot:CDW83589.1 ubiquitin carboxyl-terminal hydrolase 2-like [Stylonychia lemnae]